jgi:hypothetical protein
VIARVLAYFERMKVLARVRAGKGVLTLDDATAGRLDYNNKAG